MKISAWKKHIDPILCLLMTAFGGIFLLWFIKAAGCDVVYSDYIRIVADYLPDVTDADKFFVPDILTRIPAAFLQRLINVKLFSYSVTFDRICSALGLSGCAFMTALYMGKERLSALWFIPIAVVIFSLNKWEIILNGTAWAHVAAFALFFLNYYLLDRYYQLRRRQDAFHEEERPEISLYKEKRLRLSLYILPFIILMFAGEYIASYAAVMTLAYLFCILLERAEKRRHTAYTGGLAATLAVLGLYLLSRHFAVWEHAGSTDMSIFEVMAQDPMLIPRLFIKSFAGTVLGLQAINDFHGWSQPLSDRGVLILGMLVIAAYIIAIAMYIRHRLWRRSLFPMILILSGGLNHVLITAARWIFLNEDYGLSSRYGAQFMIGSIGILLTLALCCKKDKAAVHQKPAETEQAKPAEAVHQKPAEAVQARGKGRRLLASAELLLSIAIALMFYFGNRYTTHIELGIVPYREQNYEAMREAVLHYHDYDAETLADCLEWGKSTDTMYKALRILEDNRLNVFAEPAAE